MFGKSVTLFRILGFTVKADASWLVVVAMIVWSLAGGLFPEQYPNQPMSVYVFMAVIAAAGLFMSIVLHELSHALAARRFGLATKGITLFIFGGVAEMADEPADAKTEFWMALAGPAASIAIAGVFYGLAAAGKALHGPGAVVGVLGWIGYINGLLAVFNLIPGFPLDGGRVLRSILWRFKHSLARATAIAARVGDLFGLTLIGLGLLSILLEQTFGGLWWILIGWFVRSAARQERQGMLLRQALRGEPIQRFINTSPITVEANLPLQNLVDDYFYRYRAQSFPVVNQGRLEGCVSAAQVQRVPRDEWAGRTVAQVAAACPPDSMIGPGEDALSALKRMGHNQTDSLWVVEDGRLVGAVALADLMQFLKLKLQLEGPGDRTDTGARI